MDVCFVINQLAPGGAPTLLYDIIKHTEDKRYDYTICQVGGDESLKPEFEQAGARVVNFESVGKFDVRAMWRMFRFFQQNEFDIVHTHLPYSQSIGRVFARIGGIQHIVSTQHNVSDNYHPISRVLEAITRPLDTATIAVSDGVKGSFRDDLVESIFDCSWCTIYNGINVESYNEAVNSADAESVRTKWNLGEGLVFLNIARYTTPKMQKDLIRAMKWVVDELPKSKLLIVGWGPLRDELEQLTEELGLENNVKITGRVSTVEEYYSAADVFVLSSIREGAPIVLLEAMASELPVAATDIRGVREVVADGETGILTPSRSPQALGEAMIEMQYKSTRESFGNRGYERVANLFDISETTSSHLNLYEKLIN